MKQWRKGIRSRLWTFQYVLGKSLKASWCELVGHRTRIGPDGYCYCQRCGKDISERWAALKIEQGGRVRYEDKWYKINERYQPYDGSLDGRKYNFIVFTPTREDVEGTGNTRTRLAISNPPPGWGIKTSHAMIAGVETPIYRKVWGIWDEESE